MEMRRLPVSVLSNRADIAQGHKRPVQIHPLAIAIFVNGAKVIAPTIDRDLDCQYKAAFVWRTSCARRWVPVHNPDLPG
jgi:hypothetical protein